MSKWCKGYCLLNDNDKNNRKICNKYNCLNKARSRLLQVLDKKGIDYKKLTEIEKNLY